MQQYKNILSQEKMTAEIISCYLDIGGCVSLDTSMSDSIVSKNGLRMNRPPVKVLLLKHVFSAHMCHSPAAIAEHDSQLTPYRLERRHAQGSSDLLVQTGSAAG